MSGYQAADAETVTQARHQVVDQVRALGLDDLAHEAALVSSELVTNALLHGGGCRALEVTAVEGGLRIAVHDSSRARPVLGSASDESLTGRGIRLVATIAARWGAETAEDGKVVWAEITTHRPASEDPLSEEQLLAMWEEDWELSSDEPLFRVELGDVPTDLLLSAKSHVDGVAREFALASAGAEAGLTSDIPAHLASLLRSVVERFSDARLAIKHQALESVHAGIEMTRLTLNLPASAADAAEDYLAALDDVDAYCRAQRLLTVESPPQHRIFRHWYIGELVRQLRAAAADEPPPRAEPFAHRLLREVDRLSADRRASQRAARLYSVSAALATAGTPEEVAAAVLDEGVAALGAAGAGLFLATQADQLALPGAVGYDDELVARLRMEAPDAELPAAFALRTGEEVWLESPAERDRRFPELAGLEAGTVSMCAVPLEARGRRLGALRFSFTTAGLFDEDERRFVRALAAQAAQALDRAQLQHDRLDFSRRLQRSLLPPELPILPGLDVAAIYHPLADGAEVGGDFYDLWQIAPRRWAVAVGDATGHGPEAAALTALVRHTLRAVTMTEQDPEEVIARLNSALLAASDASGDEEAQERFCTVLFGVLELDSAWTVRLAGGGHPPALVASDAGVLSVPVGGSLLGVLDNPQIGATQVRLDPGDVMVLLTDGVIEARGDGVMFDVAGVGRVLTANRDSAAQVAAALESAVLAHTDGVLADDVAAVVLRVDDALR